MSFVAVAVVTVSSASVVPAVVDAEDNVEVDTSSSA